MNDVQTEMCLKWVEVLVAVSLAGTVDGVDAVDGNGRNSNFFLKTWPI